MPRTWKFSFEEIKSENTAIVEDENLIVLNGFAIEINCRFVFTESSIVTVIQLGQTGINGQPVKGFRAQQIGGRIVCLKQRDGQS